MEYTSNNFDILFTVSNDNGQTFKSPINLSNNAGDSAFQQISGVGSNVYITWFDNTEGNFEIFFVISNDFGQTFSTPINLSTTDTVGSQYSQIAIIPLNIDD